jgi:hypothetical protein
LKVCGELRKPDPKRVPMTRVRALVSKRRLDSAIIKRPCEIRGKQDPRFQETDGRSARIALVAKQRPTSANYGSHEEQRERYARQ